MPEEKEAINQVLKRWRGSAYIAIETLQDFQYLMKLWQNIRPDSKEFMVMVKMMSDADLEGWLDAHPLGLDDLAVKLGAE